MSEMNPADEARLYQEQLRGALKYRNRNDRIKRWKAYSRIVAHNYTAGDTIKDQPVVNLMAARTRAIPPMLAFNAPTFDVTYVSSEPNPNSAVASAAWLEQVWREEELLPVFQRPVLDWASIGTGAWFVGFEAAQEGEVLDAKRAAADAMGRIEQQQKARGVIEKARKMLGFGDKKAPIDPPREMTALKMMLQQRVFFERVSPFDLALDPCATGIQDCTFMARRIFLPKERAMLMFGADCPTADSIANAAIYTDESEDPFGSSSSDSSSGELPDEVKRVEVWEMWNIVTRKTVYLDSAGLVIKGQIHDWKSAYPGFPIIPVQWDEVTDSVWAEGLCAAMQTLNNELNELRRRQLAEAGKAFNRWVAPDTIPAESEEALKNAEDGSIIKMPVDIADLVRPLESSAMPPDFWGLENRLYANIDEVTRTSAAGGQNINYKTATAASMAQSNQDATMAWRQSQIEVVAAGIAERMLAACYATFDEPVVLRIPNQDPALVGPDGEAIPVGAMIDFPFVGTDNAGYVKVSVISGSMASIAKDVERQQAQIPLQLFGAEPWFDKRAYAMHYLSMYPSIKDPSRFIREQPEQMGQDQMMQPEQPEQGMEHELAPMQQPMDGAMMPPMAPDLGVGSGNPEADLLASVYGGVAPMTGVNGYPGPV